MLVVSWKVKRVSSNQYRHIDEELLELYAMGHVPESDVPGIEEHLLICSRCQDALESTAAYVSAMRSAALESRQEQWRGEKVSAGLLSLPRIAWATGAFALVAFLAIGMTSYSNRVSRGVPALVVLQSARGTPNGLGPAAPAGKPFTLALDLIGLQALSQYNVQIVDSTGNSVFKSTVKSSERGVNATVRVPLKSGMYYVRLYDNAELLREFPLTVAD
jgi:hypothetical protein